MIFDNNHIYVEGYPSQSTLRFGNWDSALNSDIEGNTVLSNSTFKSVNSIVFTAGSKLLRVNGNVENSPIESLNAITGAAISIPVGANYLNTLSINDVDRTDTKIIKIIRLPYCPVNYEYNNGVFTFDNEWQYVSGYIRYTGTRLPNFTNTSAITDSIASDMFYNLDPEFISDEETKIYQSNLIYGIQTIITLNIYMILSRLVSH